MKKWSFIPPAILLCGLTVAAFQTRPVLETTSEGRARSALLPADSSPEDWLASLDGLLDGIQNRVLAGSDSAVIERYAAARVIQHEAARMVAAGLTDSARSLASRGLDLAAGAGSGRQYPWHFRENYVY
ncbi:hypothetical protein JXO52_14190 [bacterium]|nr:hypothetical protein [bacterium]